MSCAAPTVPRNCIGHAGAEQGPKILGIRSLSAFGEAAVRAGATSTIYQVCGRNYKRGAFTMAILRVRPLNHRDVVGRCSRFRLSSPKVRPTESRRLSIGESTRYRKMIEGWDWWRCHDEYAKK